MPRRLGSVVALAATLLALPATASAQEPDRPRAFVLWIDATTLEDWAAAGGAYATLLEGGVATVAAPPVLDHPIRAALAAAETVGAGRILHRAPTDDDRPTPLWIALAAFGLQPALFSGAPSGTPATVVRAFGSPEDFDAERFAVADAQFPGGMRTDVVAMARAVGASEADVVVAQVPDTLLAERALGIAASARASWAGQTVARAERVLAAMLEAADETDQVMVLAPTPSGPRRADGVALGAIAIAAEGVPSGSLVSASTSRAGLVSLTDVAPTLLAWFGFSRDDVDRAALPLYMDEPSPPGFAGTAIGGVTGGGFERAHALEADLIDAARTHDTAARSLVITGIVLVLLAAGTVFSGRGAPPRAQRFPRGWRDGLATASVAAVLYAPALLLTPPGVAAVIAVVAGVAARAGFGRERALLAALIACAVVPLADIAAGGSLIASSALPTPIASGLRVRAAEPVVVGMVLAAFAAVGALLDRMRPTERRAPLLNRMRPTEQRAPMLVLGFGVVAVFLVGTHGAGGDVGAAIAVTPAALMLAVVVMGVPLQPRATVAIIAATIAVTGLVTLTFGPALWVHVDPLVHPRAIPGLAGARLEAFLDHLSSIWLVALAVTLAPIVVMARRRTALLGRGLWGRPFLRAGMAAAALGGVVSLVTVRGGIATASVAVVLLATVLFASLLAPDR